MSLITEQAFLRTLTISFHSLVKIEKVYENALIQNEKPQRDEKCYLRPAIMRIFVVAGIQKQSPGGVLSKTLPLIILKNS